MGLRPDLAAALTPGAHREATSKRREAPLGSGLPTLPLNSTEGLLFCRPTRRGKEETFGRPLGDGRETVPQRGARGGRLAAYLLSELLDDVVGPTAP
jgi:hypothetical protein